MSAEQWRPVVGYDGYEVSDQGRVRSLKTWRGKPGPRLLAPYVNNRGYHAVAITASDGRKPKPLVHTLVMTAFVGPRPDDQEVRHLNGDRLDNRLENLTYGTHAENYADMLEHGTHPMASRTHCKNGHEFTPENTRIETSAKGTPFRRCITCARATQSNRDRLAEVKAKAYAEGYAAALADLLADLPHLADVIETRELRAA